MLVVFIAFSAMSGFLTVDVSDSAQQGVLLSQLGTDTLYLLGAFALFGVPAILLARFIRKPVSTKCPACGQSNPGEPRYCIYCGKAIE